MGWEQFNRRRGSYGDKIPLLCILAACALELVGQLSCLKL